MQGTYLNSSSGGHSDIAQSQQDLTVRPVQVGESDRPQRPTFGASCVVTRFTFAYFSHGASRSTSANTSPGGCHSGVFALPMKQAGVGTGACAGVGAPKPMSFTHVASVKCQIALPVGCDDGTALGVGVGTALGTVVGANDGRVAGTSVAADVVVSVSSA